jgi:hypothetical protein
MSPTCKSESLNFRLRTLDLTTRSISSSSNSLIETRRAAPTTTAHQHRALITKQRKDYAS